MIYRPNFYSLNSAAAGYTMNAHTYMRTCILAHTQIHTQTHTHIQHACCRQRKNSPSEFCWALLGHLYTHTNTYTNTHTHTHTIYMLSPKEKLTVWILLSSSWPPRGRMYKDVASEYSVAPVPSVSVAVMYTLRPCILLNLTWIRIGEPENKFPLWSAQASLKIHVHYDQHRRAWRYMFIMISTGEPEDISTTRYVCVCFYEMLSVFVCVCMWYSKVLAISPVVKACVCACVHVWYSHIYLIY
jgi:hypothetical protein